VDELTTLSGRSPQIEPLWNKVQLEEVGEPLILGKQRQTQVVQSVALVVGGYHPMLVTSEGCGNPQGFQFQVL
jgi:hypothetical protein